jgi:hypothetical protein
VHILASPVEQRPLRRTVANQDQRIGQQLKRRVEIRQADSLPMKLAVFDGNQGLLALLDPVVTKPTWTAVVFEHPAMAEAMKGLFENCWRRAESLAVVA